MWMFLGRYRVEFQLIGLGVLLSLVARAIALVSIGHGVDDLVYWNFDQYNYSALAEHALREGRFIYPVVAGLANALGVTLPRAPTLSGLFLSLSLAVSAVFICHLWRIEKDRLASILVVALFSAHPYFTDMFLWKQGMFTAGIPFAVALGAILLARMSYAWAALGVRFLFSRWAGINCL
jgi:hypothetical protein